MEDKSRRTFLKIAGGTVAAGIAAPLLVQASSGPAPAGRQWAMVIDIKKCKEHGECTQCIEACHATHNVPDMSKRVSPEELPKREIKWLWKEKYEGVFPEQQHAYTTAKMRGVETLILCNHCTNPPCVRVCPTQATYKRDDGIVAMDMHRCIGCRYCIVGCPYGSRSFNFFEPWPRPFEEHAVPPNLEFPTRSKGVVEKCNFCAERLAASIRDETLFVPRCVEVCPAKALAFGEVTDENSEVRKLLEANHTIVRKPALGTGPQVYYIV